MFPRGGRALAGSINPYRQAASLVWRRLRWDLDPASWKSRRRLRGWRNALRGQRAVILCNGPSLLDVDLELLEGTFTFGLNKINLLFDKTRFRPSCIVAVNPFVLEQNAGFYNETDLPLFVDGAAGRPGIRLRPNVCFLHSTHVDEFAGDCSISVCQGNTVTYVAMQLAFHFGITRLALVGADHTFATRGTPNAVVTGGDSDPNHFDPNYFANVKWQLPDLAGSERAYHRARIAFEADGRQIVNATSGGKLEIFERQSLEQFLNP